MDRELIAGMARQIAEDTDPLRESAERLEQKCEEGSDWDIANATGKIAIALGKIKGTLNDIERKVDEEL